MITQLKGNQATLLQDCQDVARFTAPEKSYCEPVEKARNRIESRKVEVYTDLSMVTNSEWKKLLACLIVVHRYREEFDTKTKQWKDQSETSYYVSDRIFSAKKACELIRQH